jgi:hypothetical protein
MDRTSPNPISHLIDAVNALGFALRDLNASRSDRTICQDSLEHAIEAEDLLKLLVRLLEERSS